MIELGEDFFNEIIRCPIPIDLNTLRAMKRSPLGLDLYLWLTYRTFASSARCASRGGNSTGSSARTRRRRVKLLSRRSAGIVYAS